MSRCGRINEQKGKKKRRNIQVNTTRDSDEKVSWNYFYTHITSSVSFCHKRSRPEFCLSTSFPVFPMVFISAVGRSRYVSCGRHRSCHPFPLILLHLFMQISAVFHWVSKVISLLLWFWSWFGFSLVLKLMSNYSTNQQWGIGVTSQSNCQVKPIVYFV